MRYVRLTPTAQSCSCLTYPPASGRPRSRDLTGRLPVEIIATIFHYWKDTCLSNRYGLRADWVRATWICKRWREIALGTPVLWSSIVISRPVADDPVLEMQLDRAQGTALDLVVVNPQNFRGEVEDGLELVLAKKSPVKKLKIDCVECHPVVKEFMKTVAPDVESLSVYTLTWGDDGIGGHSAQTSSLGFVAWFYPESHPSPEPRSSISRGSNSRTHSTRRLCHRGQVSTGSLLPAPT